jgi:hypothetical protein
MSTAQDYDQLHHLRVHRSNPYNIYPYISLERMRCISKAYDVLEGEPQVKMPVFTTPLTTRSVNYE